MTLLDTDDPRDHRLALGASGLLGDLNQAGVLEAADVHVAQPRRPTSAGSPTRPWRWPSPSRSGPSGAARSASTSPPSPTTLGARGSAGPSPVDWLAAMAASPLAGSPAVLRLLERPAAVPRPLLA